MKIYNKTKNTVLSEDAFDATSLLDQAIGLLDKNKPGTILLHTRFGIHTFGMKKSIDILILNKNHSVVAVKQNLRPNKLFLWHPKFSLVLECPAGTITHSQTEIGNNIVFV